MTKIALLGRRTCCTPFFYPEYRALFQRHFRFADRPEDADLLIFSLAIELRDHIDEVRQCLAHNPNTKLVVLSEEPLWDTLWGGNFTLKCGVLRMGGSDYPYTVLNHFTTKIFDFDKIPYFLTTNDDFFARYSNLFSRNRQYTAAELLALWENAPIRTAFYAEKREETIHDYPFPELDVLGLSRYRTLIAREMQGEGIARVGHGWGNTVHRHKIPDWHLEKLTALDQRAFQVSGLENTHQFNYVTEKIFDAFAVLGVPIYFASQHHWVNRLVPSESYVNLYGLTVDEAVDKICNFKVDLDFIDHYQEAQSRLAELFSNPRHLVNERRRVISEVVGEFEELF